MTDQEKIRAARNEYARRYRQKHPERVKEAQERYWARKYEAAARKGDGGDAEKSAD